MLGGVAFAQDAGTDVPKADGLGGIDWGQYQMVRPSGPIPDEFLEAASAAYDRDRERITRDDSRIARKAKKDFFLESNFVINQMLHSGKVLFGDPMSRYCNDVADKVLGHDPALREGLRFYTVRSGSVNAFATDRGSIFVTLGLLARLENEAQLAFILAHEAAHVQENHTVRLAIESAKLERLRDVETQLLEGSRYSQGQESEADALGYACMEASPYPASAAVGALAILEREFRPFASDAVLDPAAFTAWPLEAPEVERDSAWVDLDMDSIGPWLAGMLDRYGMAEFGRQGDSVRYPSHPALEDRMEAVLDLKEPDAADALSEAALHPLGRKRFEGVRRMARHEMLRQYLLDGAYEQALYTAEALLVEYPDSRYALEGRARALAGLVVYADEEVERDWTPDPRSEQVFAEFGAWSDQLYRREWLATGWETLRRWADEHPELPMLGVLRDTVANRLAARIHTDFDAFPKEPFDRLDSARMRRFPYRSWRSAMPLVVEWQEDAEVVALLAAAKSRRENAPAASSKPAKRKRKADPQRILVLDPGYFRVNETSRQPIDYLGAEGKEVRYNRYLEANLKRLGKEPVAFNPLMLEASETARFADLIVLRSAFGEAFEHEGWLPPVDERALQELTERHGTQQVLWPFTLSAKDHPRLSPGFATMGSIMLMPLAPYFVYSAIAKDKHTFLVYILMDLEEGVAMQESSHYMHFGDSRGVTQSGMYYCLTKLLRP